MTGRGRTLKHLCFHGCEPDTPGSGRPPKPCKGHEQNFCGHQQNYECWQRGHRCGVGECKCQCVDCQKDATPESEPDVYASCAGKRVGKKRQRPGPTGMRSLTAGYHSLTQSLTRSLPHSLQDRARELVATMARARARELVTTLDGERLRAALCLLPLAWVRTVKGLAGTMAETPATPAQTLTTMATIIMNVSPNEALLLATASPKMWETGGRWVFFRFQPDFWSPAGFWGGLT
jgi:hypothetical protein